MMSPSSLLSKTSVSEDSMIAWAKEILLPYLESKGRRPDEWAMLIMDPATSHRTKKVKAFFRANRICLAMMPASTTYKFQLIDVGISVFKGGLWGNFFRFTLKAFISIRMTPGIIQNDYFDHVRHV